MRLTDEDKTLLRSWGEKKDAFLQIQATTSAMAPYASKTNTFPCFIHSKKVKAWKVC